MVMKKERCRDNMDTTTTDLSWLCLVGVIVLMIPVIYYGTRSRLKYARKLLSGKSKGTTWLSSSVRRKPETRFRSSDEFYKAINVLIERLRREGHSKEAQKLDTLMHTAWTTGSEFLGEIMLTLKGMKGEYSPELRKEINECFEFALHHRKILGLNNGG
jgi:hypothetical protein